jgi:hypothetical protein
VNQKLLPVLAAALVFAGCSKNDQTAAPPVTPPPQSAPPAQATPPAAPAISADAQKALDAVANATNTPARSDISAVVPTPQTAPAPSVSPAPAPVASSTPALSLANLSSDQISQGLKEALGKGLKQAVSSLGHPGGFLTNANVKIPMPDKLQTVEKTLRTVGQGQLADQMITTMNQAAEQAVPVAADVFVNAMKNMSVDDAKGILNGPPDAATQYFRRTTQAELTAKFSPIVQDALGKTGATAAYEQLMGKAKSSVPFFNSPSFDLNAYVTGKALDGLFKMVADEEKNIRANPVARSTDLLKSVFGSLGK